MSAAKRRKIRATSDDPVEEVLEHLTTQVENLVETVTKGQGGSPPDGIVFPKWVVVAVFVALLGTIGSGLTLAVTVERRLSDRVTVIESNRFTDTNAADMRRDIEAGVMSRVEMDRRLMDHERRLERLEQGYE